MVVGVDGINALSFFLVLYPYDMRILRETGAILGFAGFIEFRFEKKGKAIENSSQKIRLVRKARTQCLFLKWPSQIVM